MVMADHDNNVSGQPSLPEESSCGAFKYRQFLKRHTALMPLTSIQESYKHCGLTSIEHTKSKIDFCWYLLIQVAFVDFIWFWMFLFGSGSLGWFRMVSVDFR